MMPFIKQISPKQTLIVLIVSAFLIRLSLISLPSFKIDMDAWVAWSYRLNDVGTTGFYSSQIWTNYTPGYLYFLHLFGLLAPDQQSLIILIKLISISFEIALVIFLFLKLKTLSNNQKLILSALLLFNPATIFNSTVWGQIDGILTFFLVLAVFYLTVRKPQKSSLAYAFAFLIKPQSIALAPLYLINLAQNFKLKYILQMIIPGAVIFLLLSAPFFPTDPFLGIFRLIFQMTNDYAATSLFAYNFWGVIGFWIDDLTLSGPLSYRTIGNILFFGFIAFTIYLGIKKKAPYFLIASLLTLGFYFLPTRVHERYLYPAIPLLFISGSLYKNKSLIYTTILLSLTHFLNLYYVYIYYNEVYLKLPSTLMVEPMFNFLDKNGKLLSFIQSVIFIIIVWIVIKIVYAKKSEKAQQKS